MVLKVEKTSFRENASFGVTTQYRSSGATTTTIDDNRMDLITIDGSGIRIDTDTPAQTHKLRIKGNTIDLHAGANSGASVGMDIRVRQAATVQALIDANTVLDAEAIGINITVGSAVTTANLQATVSNNIVTSADPLALYGIAVQSGVSAGTNATVCLNEQANNVNTTNPAAVANYFIRRVSATLNTFNLSGSVGAITSAAGVQSWLLNAPRSNLPNTPAMVSVLGSAAPGFGTCTVVVPTF
jgi:hypothetical protein